jgi:TatD DNase family protein
VPEIAIAGAAAAWAKKPRRRKVEMAMLTDTHAHMCDAVFDGDRESVLDRASEAGLGAVVSVGEDLSDAQKNLALAKQFPLIRPAAGLYPTHLDPDAADEMMAFVRANRTCLCAIGEVGLDYWKVTTDRERAVQREIFSRFIGLSRELDLPLNIHSRSAGRHAVGLLIDQGARRVQLHAFDGKIASARPALEAGYYFSIPPSIVRSRQKQKLVTHLPLERLLLESDSPVLGPDAGVRNEPANLMLAAQAIAAAKDLPVQAVFDAAVANTQNLYGL